MKKSKQIILTIVSVLIVNLILITLTTLSQMGSMTPCESELNRFVASRNYAIIYLIAVIIQIIIFVILLITKKYKIPYVIGLLLFLAIAVFLYSPAIKRGFSPQYIEFNKHTWKTGIPPDRMKYAQGIIERKDLENMSYQQIIDYLGTPDYEEDNLLKYNMDLGVFFVSITDNQFDKVWVECKSWNELRE